MSSIETDISITDINNQLETIINRHISADEMCKLITSTPYNFFYKLTYLKNDENDDDLDYKEDFLNVFKLTEYNDDMIQTTIDYIYNNYIKNDQKLKQKIIEIGEKYNGFLQFFMNKDGQDGDNLIKTIYINLLFSYEYLIYIHTLLKIMYFKQIVNDNKNIKLDELIENIYSKL